VASWRRRHRGVDVLDEQIDRESEVLIKRLG